MTPEEIKAAQAALPEYDPANYRPTWHDTPMDTLVVLSKSALEYHFTELTGGAQCYMVSLRYILPTEESFYEAMAVNTRKALRQFPETSYKTVSRACGHFTRLSTAVGGWVASFSHEYEADTPLGLFGFTTRRGVGHAIACSLVRSGPRTLKLVFFETITQQPAFLTPEEIDSCEFCLF